MNYGELMSFMALTALLCWAAWTIMNDDNDGGAA